MKHLIGPRVPAVSLPTQTHNSVQGSGRSVSTTGFGYLDFDYLDKTAIVTVTIRPYQPGQIYFRGSWWRAACVHNTEVAQDAIVRVVGMKNITYIVEPF